MFEVREDIWRARRGSCRTIPRSYRQVIRQIDFLCDNRPKREEDGAINILMAQGFSLFPPPPPFCPVRCDCLTQSQTKFLLVLFSYIVQDADRWEGEFKLELTEYELLLFQAFKNGQFDNDGTTETWTLPNTMFFCATIYTTIGE